jgi:DNA-binding NarL/FixJ family response regulator
MIPRLSTELSRSVFRGYLSRAAPFPEFLKAIHAIVDGETVFPKPFADEADQYPRMTERLSTLTHQEREILAFLVEGSDTRTIARRLGISSSEVGDLRKAIFRKLDPRQGLEE